MKPAKSISEWRNVFVDTSVIIDYLTPPNQYDNNPKVKIRVEFVHTLMDELTKGKSPNGGRRFLVSAITVGELIQLTPGRASRTHDIVSIFNASDVEFIDYTKDVALFMNNSLEQLIPKENLKEFKAGLLLERVLDGGKASARHWISDDLKIVATAKFVRGLDVVLTSDHRTFKPIADRLNVPCLVMNKDEFPVDVFGEIDLVGFF